jgi:hypothetical protein
MSKPEKIKDDLYIKKDRFGYHIVHPIRNEDGTINWKNFLIGGDWFKFITFIIIFILVIFMAWSYFEDTSACRELMENPYEICGYGFLKNSSIDMKGINLSYYNETLHSLPILTPSDDKVY